MRLNTGLQTSKKCSVYLDESEAYGNVASNVTSEEVLGGLFRFPKIYICLFDDKRKITVCFVYYTQYCCL